MQTTKVEQKSLKLWITILCLLITGSRRPTQLTGGALGGFHAMEELCPSA